MLLEFSAALWYWRGPSPFHFVTVPDAESEILAQVAPTITYGWGMIPCVVSVGATEWTTSLWPHGEQYLVPVKSAVRHAEQLELGDVVTITLRLH